MTLWGGFDTFKPRSVTIFLILMSIIGSGYSQITLSTGWGPGKRSLYPDDTCRMNIKSVIGICQSLMTKLRQLMICESRLLASYGQGDVEESTNHIYNYRKF